MSEKTIKTIYRLNDEIFFRTCSLFNSADASTFGDCTNFYTVDRECRTYYNCSQGGIHFHCTKHPEIELECDSSVYGYGSVTYSCPKCRKTIEIKNPEELKRKCLRMLNSPEFKDAKLVRLDDWYVHVVNKKEKDDSGYWIKTEVKTDKDGDTMIVVYVGHKDFNEKAQFFIKPEKGQLTSDHKDMDPAKVLSKIEVTFKGRKLTQEYTE